MDVSKPWYKSFTIWGSIFQMVVGIAVAAGVIDAATGAEIQSNGPAMIVNLIQAMLGVWTFYGRIRAKHVITNASIA